MTKARVNADNASADIQGVTAGTGLSGGGTSGTVTLTNDMATTIDAAGDLLYGTGADTYTRLGIGAAGRVLKVNSGATAPEWAVDPTTDVVTTAGDLIYGTGADAVTRLGIGTAGQYLKVNSGATAPEWATLSAGGMTLLSTTSLSGTSTTVSGISSDYTHLYIELVGATWNTGVQGIQLGTNSMGSDGAWVGLTSSTTSAQYGTVQTRGNISAGQAFHQSNGFKSSIWIYDYTATNGNRVGSYSTWGFYTNQYRMQLGSFGWYSTSTVSSITIFGENSYTFTGGTIKVYGVK